MTDMTAEQAFEIVDAELRRDIPAGGSQVVRAWDVIRQALTAPRVPEGWPTDDMVIRGADALHDELRGAGCYFDFDHDLKGTERQQGIAEAVFGAMLDAAPAPAERNSIGASFSKMPPYEYQRQASSGDERIAGTISQAPADATLINEGNMGQVSDSDEIAKLRERVNCAATNLDILAAQIAAAGIAGFGNVARDIAARLREGGGQ